jgi:pimeloyl-ACP methyl ester carboxylesterase
MDVEANAAMWGPPGAPDPGPLATMDLRPSHYRIDASTLVIAGRHDGMTSGHEYEIRAGIPGSQLVVFENSAHYPFAEEPGRFFETLGAFLARAGDPARRRL